MAKTQQPDPAQLTFAVFAPPVIIPNGDGFTVKPGRPLLALTALQLAQQFHKDRDTVYRWRSEGLIPDKFIKFAGKRQLLFDAQVVSYLQAQFAKLHE